MKNEKMEQYEVEVEVDKYTSEIEGILDSMADLMCRLEKAEIEEFEELLSMLEKNHRQLDTELHYFG